MAEWNGGLGVFWGATYALLWGFELFFGLLRNTDFFFGMLATLGLKVVAGIFAVLYLAVFWDGAALLLCKPL